MTLADSRLSRDRTPEYSWYAVRIDFAACLTAALVFVCDVGARRPCTVAVDFEHCVGLPRLPNERLYLLP